MASTPEGKVKAKVNRKLKELGVYKFSPIGGPYSTKGVPDIICCYRGLFIGIECKAGNGKPTELQQINLRQIEENGGLALLVNEHNVDTLIEYIRGHRIDK